MRGNLRTAAATGLLLLLGPGGLMAQARVVLGVGGGAILPTKGDNSFGPDVKSAGYHLQFMVGIAPGNGKVSVRFDGQYGSVNYENPTGVAETPKDKIFAVHGDLVLHPTSGGSVRPYLLAGPSFGHFSFRSGTTTTPAVSTDNFGFNGGAGLNFGNANKVWFFVESRYVYTKEHKYIPVTVGVRINTSQAYSKK